MKWFRDNIIQLIIVVATVVAAFTAIEVRMSAQEDRICKIEKEGSPAVKGLKKDVRWIMENMAAKWGLVIPKDEVQ